MKAPLFRYFLKEVPLFSTVFIYFQFQFLFSGVIGTNCHNLEVLDAEEDSEMTATDHGLAFLVKYIFYSFLRPQL